jgi:integrase/recombinase XerD
VPSAGVFPRAVHRPAPYLYSDSDIQRLLDAAARLAPPLRAATCVTVLGLLAATGMRVGEVLGLAPGDVDLATGAVTITGAKLDRSRLVPLHASVTAALASYAALRDSLIPEAAAFFVSSAGRPLAYSTLKETFNQLTTATGLRTPARRPRMHDFRHRFAVRVLADAYRSGADVAARMTVLSAYLGHAEPANTYWYLSATPELMELAAARLDGQNRTRP